MPSMTPCSSKTHLAFHSIGLHHELRCHQFLFSKKKRKHPAGNAACRRHAGGDPLDISEPKKSGIFVERILKQTFLCPRKPAKVTLHNNIKNVKDRKGLCHCENQTRQVSSPRFAIRALAQFNTASNCICFKFTTCGSSQALGPAMAIGVSNSVTLEPCNQQASLRRLQTRNDRSGLKGRDLRKPKETSLGLKV